jgi:large subunit ribosomal protein L2
MLTFFRLVLSKKNSSGRNNTGKITVRHRGGGVKRKLRVLDFSRNLWNCTGVVCSVEYDPNRGSSISLISFVGGFLAYRLSTKNVIPGDLIYTGVELKEINLGDTTILGNFPLNSRIHSIESSPLSCAKYTRGAGTFSVLLEKGDKFAVVTLNSNIKKKLLLNCMATRGRVTNEKLHYRAYFKAGQSRKLGIRPKVRGVVMNAVDHPHGGGKGKKSPNVANMSPWRRLPKGKKTVEKKKCL